MASTKAYLDFVLEQLSGLDEISSRAMMGEFILYYRGKVFGGIYDDRLLVKPIPVAVKMMPNAKMEPPYGREHYMNNNLKGKLAVMDSLGIKPNYAVLGRKMVWTGVQLRNTTMVMKGEIVVLRFSTKLGKSQTTRV